MEAIVLHIAKYTDRAQIVHLYTRDGGRQQMMLYGSAQKRRGQNAVFQPLALIDLQSAGGGQDRMATVREAVLLYVPQRTDVVRQTLSIFIAEVLYRTLTHPLADEQLFEYLKQMTERIDRAEMPQNIHLSFLLQYANYLGFMPMIYSDGAYLDMTTGETASYRPLHPHYFDSKEIEQMQQLMETEQVFLSRSERQTLLRKLVDYYTIQLADFYEPKSLEVLTEVFS